MRKSLTAMALMLAVTASSGIAAAQGAAPMDLRGHWTAMSDAIEKGHPMHHLPGPGTGPRLDHIEVTYAITGQDGRRFWGTVSFKRGGAEPIMGVIGFDGKTIVARDKDGLYQGSIVDRDTIDVIYSQQSSESTVVAAHRFKRQK